MSMTRISLCRLENFSFIVRKSFAEMYYKSSAMYGPTERWMEFLLLLLCCGFFLFLHRPRAMRFHVQHVWNPFCYWASLRTQKPCVARKSMVAESHTKVTKIQPAWRCVRRIYIYMLCMLNACVVCSFFMQIHGADLLRIRFGCCVYAVQHGRENAVFLNRASTSGFELVCWMVCLCLQQTGDEPNGAFLFKCFGVDFTVHTCTVGFP